MLELTDAERAIVLRALQIELHELWRDRDAPERAIVADLIERIEREAAP